MKRDEFRVRLHRELDGVRVSPALRQRTMAVAQGKGAPIVRRKMTFALAAALMTVLLCAAALAAAGRWGMLDFVGRYQGSYIPEDAQDYVQKDVLTMENEWATVTIRELYYDGRISRMTADVTPKGKNVLLMGEDACMEDPFINLTQEYVVDGENDMRSICQMIEDEGYTEVYVANVGIVGQNDVYTGVMDYVLGEDGTLTIYSQEEYISEKPEREVTIQAILMPYERPYTLESRVSYEDRRELQENITLKASVYPAGDGVKADEVENVYVNEASVMYESVGVRVDRLLMEVKPQDIYVTLDYTVVDREKYNRLEGGLWFEFVNPDSREKEYHNQRLKAGLTGGGSCGPADGDLDTATRFTQRETLARNELREAYTVRAFSAWEKERFEAHTLIMRPATAEDMKENE